MLSCPQNNARVMSFQPTAPLVPFNFAVKKERRMINGRWESASRLWAASLFRAEWFSQRNRGVPQKKSFSFSLLSCEEVSQKIVTGLLKYPHTPTPPLHTHCSNIATPGCPATIQPQCYYSALLAVTRLQVKEDLSQLAAKKKKKNKCGNLEKFLWSSASSAFIAPGTILKKMFYSRGNISKWGCGSS